jgi:hypothetical protein
VEQTQVQATHCLCTDARALNTLSSTHREPAGLPDALLLPAAPAKLRRAVPRIGQHLVGHQIWAPTFFLPSELAFSRCEAVDLHNNLLARTFKVQALLEQLQKSVPAVNQEL